MNQRTIAFTLLATTIGACMTERTEPSGGSKVKGDNDGESVRSFAPTSAEPPLSSNDVFTLGMEPGYDKAVRGGGNYGEWVTGELGLPAYRYNHKAVAGRSYTAQPPYHMLGNTGSLAHSYADGTHVLFSTRTFPRFANYIKAERGAFGGGFGYVRDHKKNQLWSTHYPTSPAKETFETTWGTGYARKQVSHDGVEVVETTFAPVGDDEVLLQKIVVTNRSEEERDLSYYSYWDWDPYIIIRQFTPIARSYHENENYLLARDQNLNALKATVISGFVRLEPRPAQRSGDLDRSARSGFFSLLNNDEKIDAYELNQSKVFPQKTPMISSMPALQPFAQEPASNRANPAQTMFLAEKKLKLAKGESKTLYTLYGMARSDDADQVINRYRANPESHFEAMLRDYERKSVQFTAKEPNGSQDENWLGREVAWSAYYLNAGAMLEDGFCDPPASTTVKPRCHHAVNQNSVYMTGQGQNMAPRDVVQYALPLIYSNPELAKESLRFLFRLMQRDGKLPFGSSSYGWVSAVDGPIPDFALKPSDLGFWLQYGVAEYVDATRDYAFLDELVYDYDSRPFKVIDLLERSLAYQKQVLRGGKNGLLKILKSDWADFLTVQSGNPALSAMEGESHHTTALGLLAFHRLDQLAKRLDRQSLRTKMKDVFDLETLRKEMMEEWQPDRPGSDAESKRGFFKRAYLYGDDGGVIELGKDHWWAESNAFALMVEPPLLAETEQIEQMINAITDPKLGAVTGAGVNITSAVEPGYRYPADLAPGNTTWYSLSGALVTGLTQYVDKSERARDLAWDEFKRATLANHAELYPDMFYGIVSGSDAWDTDLNESFSGRQKGPNGKVVEGSSWLEDFAIPAKPGVPAMTPSDEVEHSINNMHSHSHVIHNALRLVGVRANSSGYVIRPAMPTEDGFGWESRTFGVRYEEGRITGKVLPRGSDTVTVRVKLTSKFSPTETPRVTSNGAAITAERDGDSVVFRLNLTANHEVRWSVER